MTEHKDHAMEADFVASGVDAFDGRFFVINMRNGKSVVNTGVNPRPAEFCHSQWIGNMTGVRCLCMLRYIVNIFLPTVFCHAVGWRRTCRQRDNNRNQT